MCGGGGTVLPPRRTVRNRKTPVPVLAFTNKKKWPADRNRNWTANHLICRSGWNSYFVFPEHIPVLEAIKSLSLRCSNDDIFILCNVKSNTVKAWGIKRKLWRHSDHKGLQQKPFFCPRWLFWFTYSTGDPSGYQLLLWEMPAKTKNRYWCFNDTRTGRYGTELISNIFFFKCCRQCPRINAVAKAKAKLVASQKPTDHRCKTCGQSFSAAGSLKTHTTVSFWKLIPVPFVLKTRYWCLKISLSVAILFIIYFKFASCSSSSSWPKLNFFRPSVNHFSDALLQLSKNLFYNRLLVKNNLYG